MGGYGVGVGTMTRIGQDEFFHRARYVIDLQNWLAYHLPPETPVHVPCGARRWLWETYPEGCRPAPGPCWTVDRSSLVDSGNGGLLTPRRSRKVDLYVAGEVASGSSGATFPAPAMPPGDPS
jgi:hypothetical protein